MRWLTTTSVGLALVTLAACATSPSAPIGSASPKTLTKSCARSSVDAIRNDYVESAQSSAAIPGFPNSTAAMSARSVTTAHIIRAGDILERVITLEQRDTTADLPAQLELLKARQELSDRIILAMLDVSRIRSESDCEKERGDLLKANLEKVEGRRQRSWTIAGVVFGAMTSIVSGGLGLAALDTGANAANVTGGLISTYAGLAALSSDGTIAMQSDRNLLHDLYTGPPQSDIFPVTVWRYFNRKLRTAGTGGATVREDLIRQWLISGVLGESGSELETRRLQLITGTGGLYKADDLVARGEMLDLFDATISSMNEDIEYLLNELTRRRVSSNGAGR